MGLFSRRGSGNGDEGSKDGTPTTDVTPSSCNHDGASAELSRTNIGSSIAITYSCQRCGSNYTRYRPV